jgi:hypothetical protein
MHHGGLDALRDHRAGVRSTLLKIAFAISHPVLVHHATVDDGVPEGGATVLQNRLKGLRLG